MTVEAFPEADRVEGAPHPRHTAEMFGQSAAEAEFLDAFNSDRLHHAWLISGPQGVGKATLAWRIAKFLLAQPSGDGGMFADAAPARPDSLQIDPDHPVARRVEALSEPRLFLCRRPWDEKGKRLRQNITVEETRKLKSFFTLSATDGGYRVAIVDAADEMNAAAANALLKILEEPPEKTVLLLVSHQPSRLLPTIRSRCRTLACKTLGAADMAAALSNAGFDAGDQGQALAILSGGSVGEAVRLLSGDGLALYSQLVSLASAAPQLDRSAAIRLADSCTGKTAEARYTATLRLIFLLLSRLARFGALQPPVVDEATTGEARMLAKLAPDANAARRWANLAQDLSARSSHARAVNLDPSTVILDMLLKLNETAQA